MAALGQLVFDEYGKPIIILKDQDQQKRLTGIDALKVRVVIPGRRCGRLFTCRGEEAVSGP